MQNEIELLRQARVEVVACALRLGQIEDTDRPLEPGCRQCGGDVDIVAQRQQETRNRHVMEQPFVAAGERRTYLLAMHRTVPGGCRGDGAAVGREAHENRRRAVYVPDELADVELTSL